MGYSNAVRSRLQYWLLTGTNLSEDKFEDKPPVARIQTLFIRKIIVKIEYNAPMARARELLVQVQKEMVSEDRFKSLIVYYDVDPM